MLLAGLPVSFPEVRPSLLSTVQPPVSSFFTLCLSFGPEPCSLLFSAVVPLPFNRPPARPFGRPQALRSLHFLLVTSFPTCPFFCNFERAPVIHSLLSFLRPCHHSPFVAHPSEFPHGRQLYPLIRIYSLQFAQKSIRYVSGCKQTT